ncbi:MAG TPA: hypothetical protein VK673_21880 [Chthoniobacterales bacterium]|nr:hypothetical protein [Chthoniobacterales bacterium]
MAITGAAGSIAGNATGFVCQIGGYSAGGQLKRWSVLLDAASVTVSNITVSVSWYDSLSGAWVTGTFFNGGGAGQNFGALVVAFGTATYIVGNAPVEGLQVNGTVAGGGGTFRAVILGGT